MNVDLYQPKKIATKILRCTVYQSVENYFDLELTPCNFKILGNIFCTIYIYIYASLDISDEKLNGASDRIQVNSLGFFFFFWYLWSSRIFTIIKCCIFIVVWCNKYIISWWLSHLMLLAQIIVYYIIYFIFSCIYTDLYTYFYFSSPTNLKNSYFLLNQLFKTWLIFKFYLYTFNENKIHKLNFLNEMIFYI